MGCPYYETEEEFQIRLAKIKEKERRKKTRLAQERLRKEAQRAKQLKESTKPQPPLEPLIATTPSRTTPFNEADITNQTPLQDILSNLDENLLPP